MVSEPTTHALVLILCLAAATTMLPNPVATAQDPTNISTMPNPNCPYVELPLRPVAFPFSYSIPDRIGPRTAAKPRKKAVPPNAIPVCSGLEPAHSAIASHHTEGNPPI